MAPVSTSINTNDEAATKRRIPTQERSRLRVERILDATSELVLDSGVEQVTTRAIAQRADVPVASLYQYFADRDAILLAIAERDMAEMDEQVAADLGQLTTFSVRTLVETTMRAYVKVYHRRPAFMQIWLRGRNVPALNDYGRDHNRRTAAELWDFATALGMIAEGTPPAFAELGVEVGDRVFQLAFETNREGDPLLIEEGIDLVTAYFERHATEAGRLGVSS